MAENDEHQLERTNVGIARWEQERDEKSIERLDQVLSPHLLFRRANKSVVGKSDFMAGLGGPSPFDTRESEDVTVEIMGDRAVAVLTVVTTKTDGTEERFRNIRMFGRRGDEWQVEFWFNDDVTHVTGL